MSRVGRDEAEADREERTAALLQIITTRRVVRDFSAAPVSDSDLRTVLTAARWATRGSNTNIHRLLVIRDPALIQQVRAFSPGMLGLPAAMIVICTDPELAAEAAMQLDKDSTRWIDVGTAAMNMMLAAHALGLGSCPLTSFSKSAVSLVLKLPPDVVPEFILQLGHPTLQSRSVRQGPPTRVTVDDLVFWESYGTTARMRS